MPIARGQRVRRRLRSIALLCVPDPSYDGVVSPYREMPDVLGAEEREAAAVEALGCWRMRVRGWIYAVAAMIGAVVGFFGIFAVTELQFALQNHARMGVSMVLGFGGPFVAALGVGVIGARLHLARATPARVAELARRYEIDPHRLREVADLVRGL
jgi:hypothetical protein